MFKKKSMESVLKEIYEAYPDAFADGQRLSGLFADFSGGQLRAQKNQLDVFLKCGGNTRILALRDETPRIQQREYHRLVGEMMDAYSMQQERALEISSIFWKTALGTQAPAMGGQEKKEKPAKKPSEKRPRAQRLKGLLILFGKMSGFARLMFAVGAYGVIACTTRLVQVMITEGFADAAWFTEELTEGFADVAWFFYLLIGGYLLDVGAKVFYMLPRELSRIEKSVIYSKLYYFVYFNDVFGWPFLLLLTGEPTIGVLIGVFACWGYNIVWLVRLGKSTKKNVPMWQ